MTSAREAAGSPPLHPAGGGRRRSALDQLPPPANSNKPLTPFGIEDILGRPRGGSPPGPGPAAPPARLPEKAAGPRGGGCAPSSPLCALEELASKTFQGLELGVLQAAEGTGRCGAAGAPPGPRGHGNGAGAGAGAGGRRAPGLRRHRRRWARGGDGVSPSPQPGAAPVSFLRVPEGRGRPRDPAPAGWEGAGARPGPRGHGSPTGATPAPVPGAAQAAAARREGKARGRAPGARASPSRARSPACGDGCAATRTETPVRAARSSVRTGRAGLGSAALPGGAGTDPASGRRSRGTGRRIGPAAAAELNRAERRHPVPPSRDRDCDRAQGQSGGSVPWATKIRYRPRRCRTRAPAGSCGGAGYLRQGLGSPAETRYRRGRGTGAVLGGIGQPLPAHGHCPRCAADRWRLLRGTGPGRPGGSRSPREQTGPTGPRSRPQWGNPP